MTLAPVRDDLPAVFTPPTRQDTDSWVNVVGDVVRLANQIAGTDFVPKGIRNSVPATAAAMLYGREVGLPPMTALTQIFIVDGRPGMYAEAMRALVLAAGHDIAFDETTGAMCRMRGRRSGSTNWTEVAWSIDMARAAGLLGPKNLNWHKYPRAMLVARCTADLCRMIFPDVIHGFRVVEELNDMGEETGEAVTPSIGKTTTVARKTSATRRPRKTSADDATPSPRPASSADLPPLPGEDTIAEAGGDAGHSPPAEAETPPAVPDDEAGDDPDRRAGRPQLRLMFGQLRRLGLDDSEGDREERLALVSAIIGRQLTTTNDLTTEEAQEVIVTISSVRDADALRALLARIEAGDAQPPMFDVEDPPAVDPPPPSESE